MNETETPTNSPSLEEVQTYCKKKGYTFSVENFMKYNKARNWTFPDGSPVNWKRCADWWGFKESRRFC